MSIQKMKAGLSAVISENPKLIQKTKEFYKFLEQNDRQLIMDGKDILGEVEATLF